MDLTNGCGTSTGIILSISSARQFTALQERIMGKEKKKKSLVVVNAVIKWKLYV